MKSTFLKAAAASLFSTIIAILPAQQTTSTVPVDMSKSIYEIPVSPMKADGTIKAETLAQFKGKVLLIVNVASKCGFTPQYADLEKLYQEKKEAGLVVLGFPSNDFRQQEPGTEQEILEFCKAQYGVTFPMFAKVKVTGEDKAPLYKYLTEGDHPGRGEVKWNFNKFLVGKDGKVVAHYDSKVKPSSPELLTGIDQELEK